MVSAFSLWLPILLSAVIVFVASSIIHMVLGYHKSDMKAVPNEDQALATMRAMNLPPGLGAPAFKEKMAKGPIVTFTTAAGGSANMGSSLLQWFIYCIVASFVSAYIAGISYPQGATYPQIFRIAGTAGFACFAMALPQDSIWYKRNWMTTLKNMFDGFVYGCLIGGTFGWLWPR